MKKNLLFLLGLIPLVLMMVPFSSCNAPKPCYGIVTVMDSAGRNYLANVKVHLYANITYNNQTTVADLKVDVYTGHDGKASFTMKNPCVMDITASVANCTSSPGHYCTATGIIKFEEGQTNTKTVFVNQ